MRFKQGDVFLARLNPTKGKEPGKDRPVIIMQADLLNEINYPTAIVIPCSSLKMPASSLRPLIKEDFFNKETYALIDQVRAVDVKKRLLRKMGELSSESLKQLQESLHLILS